MPAVARALAAACLAASRGLAVFPLPPGGRRAEPGWQDQCTTDPDVICRWTPGGNVGVGCRASNIVVLDLDQHTGEADGIARFRNLCYLWADDGLVVDTLTVRTPHGQHLYFRPPAGRTFGSASGRHSSLGPGIDVRGPGRRTGGYVVGPGSVVDGVRYLADLTEEIRDLPPWLADMLP